MAGTTSVKRDERMNDLTLRPPRNRVERRAIGWWTAQSSLFALPLPVVFAVLYLTIPPARTWFGWSLAGTLVPGVVYMAAMPAWRYRVHRWETTDDAVYAASGWLWQRWRVVPLSRVQTVDSLRGPVQQLFGLSGITVTTASTAGAVKINGLDRRVAADLVRHLTRCAEATPGDAV
jgi:membrane protein YdbS with pleckstrin-like domain